MKRGLPRKSGEEEELSNEDEEEDIGRTKRRRVEGWPIPKLNRLRHHRWLLKSSQKLANLHNTRKDNRDYEAALRHCVEKYKYIYLFTYNDSTNLGFRIFEQVLRPSCRLVVDCKDYITAAVLGTSWKDELKPGIHKLSLFIQYNDIGFCFSDLPRENIIREISNYQELYTPDEYTYGRSTVIFQQGLLMAGRPRDLHENLKVLGFGEYVESKDGVLRVLKDITWDQKEKLTFSNYTGHNTKFIDDSDHHRVEFLFKSQLLGCWNKDNGALEIYPRTQYTDKLRRRLMGCPYHKKFRGED